eukprot:TRINITY_DN9341_c0_g2_i1.p1 TRINITY_DN9341_c0_g2~~TRINITY_DN9341_c0_g2_i1.p1  ORF type:complete len:394 (-),score=78.61 TRINITY_DN9341_c0_g2_i1:1962-3143(-)
MENQRGPRNALNLLTDNLLAPLQAEMVQHNHQGLVRVVTDIKKKLQKRLTVLDSHLDTQNKYPEGKLQRVFALESQKEWQWVEEYKSIARPCAHESTAQTADMNETYDIAKAWKRLREQHAQQCQNVLRSHSIALVQHLQPKLTVEGLREELQTALRTYFISVEGAHYNEEEKVFFEKKCSDYLHLTRRQLLAQAGRSKALLAEAAKKREENLRLAQTVYESADVKTLLAMATVAVGSKDKQSYKEGSLMHYLTHSIDGNMQQPIDTYLKHIKEGKMPPPHSKKGSSGSGNGSGTAMARSISQRRRSISNKPQQKSRSASRPRTPARQAATPPKGRGRSAERPKSALRDTMKKSTSQKRSISQKRSNSRNRQSRSTSAKKVTFGRWRKPKKQG